MNCVETGICFRHSLCCLLLVPMACVVTGIRFPDRTSQIPKEDPSVQLKMALFALGSFWRSEAAFGCLDGVVRTNVGYAGGTRINPEYRSLGDHAECVKIEYDPKIISYNDLLEYFWKSHDPTQVFGQGPDVGNQYRLAEIGKEREQKKWRDSIITTQIQKLGTFYGAETEHQKFELKRNPFLLQLIGNLSPEELERSTLAAKLNGYAADRCPHNIRKKIRSKIDGILANGWPLIREV